MDKLFCKKCGELSPKCAIYEIPQNTRIEDLVNQVGFSNQECLVCYVNAQTIEEGLVMISSN